MSRGPGNLQRPVFVLHLRPEPGVDAERALRRLLKTALRAFGLRALACQPARSGITVPAPDVPDGFREIVSAPERRQQRRRPKWP